MKITQSLELLFQLTKIQAILSRKFDSALNGISLNEFIILHHLKDAPDQKLRRTDLAEAVGLTPSGITRLLLPMEKIGLVKRRTNPNDARTSEVVLASGGKQKLEEGYERAELLLEEFLPKYLELKDNKTVKVL